MENYELISDFLDGALDGPAEVELFSTLASSEEYRNELKQQLALKTAIRSDIQAYSPSAASTLSLFSALGIAPVQTPLPVPQIASKVPFYERYKHIFYSGLFSAAAVLTIFSFALRNSGSKSLQSSLAVNDDKVPVVISYKAAESSVNSSAEQRIVYRDKIVYVDRNSDPNSGKSALSGREIMPIWDSPYINEDITVEFNSVPDQAIIPASIPTASFGIAPSAIKRTPSTGLSLEVKGFQALSKDLKKESTSDVQSFNNLNVALYYALFDKLGISSLKDFELGLDYRRENIFQSFIYYDEAQKQFYQIEQQPNLQSLGLSLRWLPSFAAINNLQPIAQVSAGGNKVGSVYRGSIGFLYKFTPNYSFVGGFDYNRYNYYHVLNFNGAKQDFTTSKYGVNFGILIKF